MLQRDFVNHARRALIKYPTRRCARRSLLYTPPRARVVIAQSPRERGRGITALITEGSKDAALCGAANEAVAVRSGRTKRTRRRCARPTPRSYLDKEIHEPANPFWANPRSYETVSPSRETRISLARMEQIRIVYSAKTHRQPRALRYPHARPRRPPDGTFINRPDDDSPAKTLWDL